MDVSKSDLYDMVEVLLHNFKKHHPNKKEVSSDKFKMSVDYIEDIVYAKYNKLKIRIPNRTERNKSNG